MTEQSSRKLNWLEQNLPEGLLVDAVWMTQNGYSTGLRSQYVSAGWLEQPARSVYRRPRGELSWQQVVISMNKLLGKPVWAGGRMALDAQGYSHYISPEGPREIHLYGDKTPPGWLYKLPLKEQFFFHNAKKLFGEAINNNPLQNSLKQMPWGQWNWTLTFSTPERALLELLDELPSQESFHQVDVMVEGLSNLSPRRLQKLLENCRSIKVKRLFFWFADRHRHAWLNRLDKSRIDLGKGKRMLVRGGKLDPVYQITVPEDLYDHK